MLILKKNYITKNIVASIPLKYIVGSQMEIPDFIPIPQNMSFPHSPWNRATFFSVDQAQFNSGLFLIFTV